MKGHTLDGLVGALDSALGNLTDEDIRDCCECVAHHCHDVADEVACLDALGLLPHE